MSKTTTQYAGIDYGLGQSNIDTTTGIRYGMIAQQSLMGEALDEVFTNGNDLGFENAEAELKDKLKAALSDYFSDHAWGDAGKPTRLAQAVDDAFDALDGWADNIESNGPMHYESDGLTLQTTERGELWVFASPYYTHAQFCSPCVPAPATLIRLVRTVLRPIA